jgi:tetratricopeptide (TPR) repeat protein
VAVKVWEADTGKLVASLPDPEVSGCVGFSPDSRWLYVVGKETRRLEVASLAAAPLRAAPPASGAPLWQGEWRSEPVKLEGTFSPDNRVRALGTGEGGIRLVSSDTDREIARLPSPEVGLVSPHAFSPDGALLLARGSETGSLYVFDLRRLREQLAELGLDWDGDQPAPPARTEDDNPALAPPLRVDLVDAEWATGRDRMNEYETAGAVVRLSVNPFDADAHYRLGGLLLEAGRFADAHAHLTAALAFHPDLDSAYHLRAAAALRLQRWADAAADATRYLEKYPYIHPIRLLRAEANHQRKWDDEAAADLTAVIQAYPQWWSELYERRAACYQALGKTALAAADRATALKLTANDPVVLNNRAWHLVTGPEGERDPAGALALIQKAVELRPDDPLLLNTLGVVQYRNDRIAEAVVTLEKSLAAGQGRADAFDLFFLAMCHAKLKDGARAKEYFGRAVQWWDRHKDLPPQWAAELRAFRAEAEALLGAP